MVGHDGVVEDEVESETKQSQQEKKRKEKPGGDNDDQFIIEVSHFSQQKGHFCAPSLPL